MVMGNPFQSSVLKILGDFSHFNWHNSLESSLNLSKSYRGANRRGQVFQTFPRLSIEGEKRRARYRARHLNLCISRGKSLFASRESDFAT